MIVVLFVLAILCLFGLFYFPFFGKYVHQVVVSSLSRPLMVGGAEPGCVSKRFCRISCLGECGGIYCRLPSAVYVQLQTCGGINGQLPSRRSAHSRTIIVSLLLTVSRSARNYSLSLLCCMVVRFANQSVHRDSFFREERQRPEWEWALKKKKVAQRIKGDVCVTRMFPW